MSRLKAKIRCNYFPLPTEEAERMQSLLRLPAQPFSALDPCVGDGGAFARILGGSRARLYGIELDAYRAEQAAPGLDQIVQGNCLETHCQVESFSLIYASPPYDWSFAGERRERLEAMFLNHVYRWLVPGGILLLVIPAERSVDCAQVLASHFKQITTFRLRAPDSTVYRQVLIIGARRSRRERELLKDHEITSARLHFSGLGREYEQLPPLSRREEPIYDVPVTGPAVLTFQGLPLDELEDALAGSPAWKQATRILAPAPTMICGRPLLPLHAGEVGLLACAGMLDGIFGSDDQLHIGVWRSKKVTTTSTEEEPDGTTIIRERERFVQSLSVAFKTGEVATLE